MAYQMITDIGSAFYQVFGQSLLLPIMIIGIIAIILMMIKAEKTVLFVVLLPVIVGIGIYASGYFYEAALTTWQSVIILSFLFGAIILWMALMRLANR